MTAHIDHLVVTAPDLASGMALVTRALGVELQAGGKHVRMATHNLVLKLGPSIYLEVISPDPDGTPPGRSRWFELDDGGPPRLAGWAARTTDIRTTAAAASEPLGTIAEMSRGDLNWLITIPEDGRLPLGGPGPALIEWRTDSHPASRMRETGCSLLALQAFHPEPARVSRLYDSIGLRDQVSVAPGERPSLVARFQTPGGPRTLAGP
ncbi:MAG: VOC family protein [Myxococcales bacterium]